MPVADTGTVARLATDLAGDVVQVRRPGRRAPAREGGHEAGAARLVDGDVDGRRADAGDRDAALPDDGELHHAARRHHAGEDGVGLAGVEHPAGREGYVAGRCAGPVPPEHVDHDVAHGERAHAHLTAGTDARGGLVGHVAPGPVVHARRRRDGTPAGEDGQVAVGALLGGGHVEHHAGSVGGHARHPGHRERRGAPGGDRRPVAADAAAVTGVEHPGSARRARSRRPPPCRTTRARRRPRPPWTS